MGRADLTRTDLGLIAACLADLDHISMYAAAKKYHVDRTTILRWTRLRTASGGTWPTAEQVAEQRHYLTRTAERRRRTQQRNALGIYRTVPSLGAVRRTQALLAMGYRLTDLADHLGVSKSRIHQLAHHYSPTLTLDTDRAVRAMYRTLCATPAPVRSEAMMARHYRMAWRNNWAPPLAWSRDEDMDDIGALPHPEWIRNAA